jgi:hypothetical protein
MVANVVLRQPFRYNTQWLIGRLGHRTAKEAYQAAITTAAA